MTKQQVEAMTAESAATAPSSKERIAWVDYSKGICIFLVLMLHANSEIHEVRAGAGWLDHVVAFARPFRMPDFFLIAGLFLGRVIDLPWRTYVDRKVLHFFYFYWLWTAIHFVLFGIKTAFNESGGDWSTVLPAYLRTFIEPGGSLWFIYCLALFFLITRLLRAVSWWLLLSAAAALQMLNVTSEWTVLQEFCRRYVYFLSGYVFARQVFMLAQWGLQQRRNVVLYLLGWAVLNQWLVLRGWAALPGVGLVLGYLGAAAVVFMGVLASTVSWTRGLKRIGEISIVLYLGDYVVQRVALKLGVANLADIGTAALLLTFISVFGTLLMYRCAMRLNFRLLYQRPAWLQVRPTGTAISDTALARQ